MCPCEQQWAHPVTSVSLAERPSGLRRTVTKSPRGQLADRHMTQVGLIFFYNSWWQFGTYRRWLPTPQRPEFQAGSQFRSCCPLAVFLVIYWKAGLANMCQTLKCDGKYFRSCSLTSLEPVFFPLSPSPIVPDRRVMIGCCHNRQTKPLVCVFSPLE